MCYILWPTYVYAQHYYNVCQPILKTTINMQILLNDYKFNQPEIFQSYLQIIASCFDELVTIIHDDKIFFNNSNNDQMPVEEQVVEQPEISQRVREDLRMGKEPESRR